MAGKKPGKSNDTIHETKDFNKKLKFLSDSSLYFLGKSSYEDVFAYVADGLADLTDSVLITVSEYVLDTNTVIVRDAKIGKKDKQMVQKILGAKLAGMELMFNDETRKKFISGKLTHLTGGIYDLSFQRIPKAISRLLERSLNVGDIYGMAFVVEKDFLGLVAILTRKGHKLENPEIIEAFINQAAVALKQKSTQQRLVETSKVLEEEKIRLEELEHKKDEFIGIASHELKTPLTSTKIFAELLKKEMPKILDEEQKTRLYYIDNLYKELGKIEKLVDDMLDVSKIEKGKLVFDIAEFDLDDLVKETVFNFQLTTHSHKITKKGSVRSKVKGDKDRIQQVLVNLLSNAVKYSPSTKKVVVSLEVAGNEAVVSIRDYGAGIAKKHLEKVFERYYRVGGKGKQGGFGLGLYISSEIIKRHDGKIWVESVKGKGSQFIFTLPLAK